MSLINDALKRAKQAHEQKTPPAFQGAPLHTIQTPPQTTSLLTLIILAGCLLVVLIGVVMLFFFHTHTAPKPLVVASQSQPVGQPPMAAPPQVQSPVPVPQPVVAKKPNPVQPGNATPMPAPEPLPAATPQLRSVAPLAPTVPMPDPTQPVVPTNLAPVAPVMAAFPEVRLQGVLYNPARPAAIINGRTLFVGDHIGDVVVTAISQSNATVVWHGQTNVLTLDR